VCVFEGSHDPRPKRTILKKIKRGPEEEKKKNLGGKRMQRQTEELSAGDKEKKPKKVHREVKNGAAPAQKLTASKWLRGKTGAGRARGLEKGTCRRGPKRKR